jgi:hypothetical protein
LFAGGDLDAFVTQVTARVMAQTNAR